MSGIKEVPRYLHRAQKGTCGYIKPWQIELVLGKKFTHCLRLHPFTARHIINDEMTKMTDN